MIFFNKIPIKVHSWGGLGSQLFALSTFYDLQKLFPKRKIIFVHHTGGVTKRFFELKTLFPELIHYKIVDDFKPNISSKKTYSNVIQRSLRNIVSLILNKIGFLNTANTNSQFNKICPWVISLRGHYSEKSVSPEFQQVLVKKISANRVLNEVENSLVIHYRLGDLLSLEDKSPVNSQILKSEMLILFNEYHFKNCFMISDSKPDTESFFGHLPFEIKNISGSLLVEMSSALSSRIFLGTNSKITLWIALLRTHYERKSKIPQSYKESIFHLNNFKSESFIDFY